MDQAFDIGQGWEADDLINNHVLVVHRKAGPIDQESSLRGSGE